MINILRTMPIQCLGSTITPYGSNTLKSYTNLGSNEILLLSGQ